MKYTCKDTFSFERYTQITYIFFHLLHLIGCEAQIDRSVLFQHIPYAMYWSYPAFPRHFVWMSLSRLAAKSMVFKVCFIQKRHRYFIIFCPHDKLRIRPLWTNWLILIEHCCCVKARNSSLAKTFGKCEQRGRLVQGGMVQVSKINCIGCSSTQDPKENEIATAPFYPTYIIFKLCRLLPEIKK